VRKTIRMIRAAIDETIEWHACNLLGLSQAGCYPVSLMQSGKFYKEQLMECSK
jgi:hypothetical protein